jgi:hypothetical protein
MWKDWLGAKQSQTEALHHPPHKIKPVHRLIL